MVDRNDKYQWRQLYTKAVLVKSVVFLFNSVSDRPLFFSNLTRQVYNNIDNIVNGSRARLSVVGIM